MQLTFNGAVAISIPSLTLPLVDFVAQGTPIPAIEGTSAAINLEPYKMAVITSLSGEMLRGSNSEAIVRQVLLVNVGPALDAAMFSDTAAVTEERPPGLLNGIAALTPTAAVAGIEAEGMIDVGDQGGGKRWASSRSRRLRGEKEPQGSLTRAGVLSSQVRLLCGAAGVSSGG